MQKIIIYYKFTPLSDPYAVRLWQKALCESLSLKGRIIISKHGINGTVGGELSDLKKYVKIFKEFNSFKKTTFKWSDGERDHFPRLSVKVRDELVAFKANDELKVDENGVVGGGKHLKPRQVHELVEKSAENVVFFDGRNTHEAAIGKFKNAVVPNTNTTHDFKKELESGKYDELKDRPIITFCNVGIRCEILSVLMKNRGFKEVYQIDGGIVKYGESYGDSGLWEGSLRVFDDRMTINFSNNPEVIGKCTHCQNKTSNYENCILASCNDLVLICETFIQEDSLLFHSMACQKEAQRGAKTLA